MNEYQVNLLAAKNGGLAFDLQPVNASGTSPYMTFESRDELRAFLSSVNLSTDMIAQLEQFCANLEPGKAFHQRMYLPRCVEEGLDELHRRGAKELLPAQSAA
ncbi:MAG: hypothetical protein ACJ74Z_04040 [Bryobacteraceae bacterium]